MITAEEEVIDVSYIACVKENSYGENVTAEQLQNKLKEHDKDAKVTKNGEQLEVIFNDTNNKYTVSLNGDINFVSN